MTTQFQTGKVYSLFNASGKIEELTKKPSLPLGCKVYCFGFGMSERQAAIISEPNQYGQQKAVYISDYEPGFTNVDEHSRPLSKKFGIGSYYADNLETYDAATVAEYIIKGQQAEKERAEAEQAKKESDAAEVAALPAMFPHLTTVKNHPKGYRGACGDNLRADLKHNFPGVKFSVKHSRGSAFDISWTDGPTIKEVKRVTDKYTDHETDITGDYRDYSASNFNRVFGGDNFVFESRQMSAQIEALKTTLDAIRTNPSDQWENGNILHGVFSKTNIPVNATDFKLERTDCTCGNIEDFYKITFIEPLTKKEEENINAVYAEYGQVEIIDYSEKAIAVIGNTKPIKDVLKNMGGRFNFRLTCGAGWIFPKTKLAEVKAAINIS